MLGDLKYFKILFKIRRNNLNLITEKYVNKMSFFALETSKMLCMVLKNKSR